MKPYVKPEMIYEDFQLSHTIANCSPAMNHTKNDCDFDSTELFGVLNPGETVFSESTCTYSLTKFMEIYEGYCLQTGSDGYNLFIS